jgi:hypothetical protein
LHYISEKHQNVIETISAPAKRQAFIAANRENKNHPAFPVICPQAGVWVAVGIFEPKRIQ